MDQSFSNRHAYDSRFWAFVWIYVLIIVILGFRIPVHDRFFDGTREPAAIALQIHVWSFGAWMVLLAMQAWFASTKRMDWHRLAGLSMLPLAAVMVWSAGLSEVRGLQRGIAGGGTGAFSAISANYLLPFIILVPLAWVARKDPPAHKRLILMATASICAGAHLRTINSFDRIFWETENFFLHFLIGFGGSVLIIGFGMIYDLATRGKLHKVYRIGAPLLIAWYLLATWAYGSEHYARVATSVLGTGE